MKDGHTTKSESSFGKKLWCVLIVLFLGGIGWQMWKLHLYNNAVREAKEAGFTWKCKDTISLIRQDWHNALKKETWGEHQRVLDMGYVPDLGRYREMLHRLRPTVLIVWKCENVDPLRELTSLQMLFLDDCSALRKLDGLSGLTGLQLLSLMECNSLESVDPLKDLTDIRFLRLTNGYVLQNVDALNSLLGLQTLVLDGCHALENVDALKGLTALQWLSLSGSDKIPAPALRELRAALPNTDITLPDGTKNPPQ